MFCGFMSSAGIIFLVYRMFKATRSFIAEKTPQYINIKIHFHSIGSRTVLLKKILVIILFDLKLCNYTPIFNYLEHLVINLKTDSFTGTVKTNLPYCFKCEK